MYIWTGPFLQAAGLQGEDWELHNTHNTGYWTGTAYTACGLANVPAPHGVPRSGRTRSEFSSAS
ncbi:hypothetical protein DBV15_08118 [Temnothorax longispinosus]|uniref:Uncharacterized protein n=1 Tax=Temnothorax longispinosus TaxID=300112 RepID=A0A4S2KH93_9HYME|nr:hypothetical protein DBV15_08118 [Temnothorax longispinosus]